MLARSSNEFSFFNCMTWGAISGRPYHNRVVALERIHVVFRLGEHLGLHALAQAVLAHLGIAAQVKLESK